MKHPKSKSAEIILRSGEGRTYNCGTMTAIFKADENETEEKYSISEWWLAPNSEGPGAHKHEQNDEVFYVLEGITSFLVGEKWIDAEKGTFLRIPAKTIHDFANRTNEKAGILNFFIPGGFERNMPSIVKWFADKPSQNKHLQNYQMIIKLNASAERVFDALTHGIPLWWTNMFEGSASKKGDLFTVRFGPSVFKTMEVRELVDNAKVVWNVTDSLIDIPELKNKSEWIGTSVVWEIIDGKDFVELRLFHLGLNDTIECYDICSSGWQNFIESFKQFVETGEGKPFTQSA